MTNTLIEARIDIACGQLRMPGLMKQYSSLHREALEQNADHLQFLASCLEHEVLKKQELKQQYLLRQAKFPKPKTLLRIPADPDSDSGSIRTLNRKHPDTLSSDLILR
jgi:DNA replication protein DnaC